MSLSKEIMSLISAVPGESTDEQPVSGRGSVYQVSGKPLSKEALYRAKLKYGVYPVSYTHLDVYKRQ